jgi:MFS family permease
LLIPSKIPGVNRTNVLYFVFIAAFAGMEFTLTFLAKDRFGYSAAQNGMLFLFIGFVIALVQGGVVRRLAPKYGEKRLVIAGLLLVLPGLIVVGRCQSVGLLYAGLFLLAFGSSLVTPCLTSLVSLYSPEDRQGESLGVFRSVGSLARAFAPILGAVLYWKFGSEWPYFTSAAVLVLPLLLTFGLPLPAKDT